jgi:hypothetical protein
VLDARVELLETQATTFEKDTIDVGEAVRKVLAATDGER